MRNQLKPDKTVVVVCVCLGEVFFYPTTAERTEKKKKKKKRRRRLKTRDPCFSIAAPFFFYYPLRFLDVFVCVCG